jgi:hypothetical protein
MPKSKEKPSVDVKKIDFSETVKIDLKEIYKFDPSKIELDLTSINYSNLAYIQTNNRDVLIDFLEMPGVKKEGKLNVQGVRIFMSHVAARALADKLIEILDKQFERGEMEDYQRTREELAALKKGKKV